MRSDFITEGDNDLKKAESYKLFYEEAVLSYIEGIKELKLQQPEKENELVIAYQKLATALTNVPIDVDCDFSVLAEGLACLNQAKDEYTDIKNKIRSDLNWYLAHKRKTNKTAEKIITLLEPTLLEIDKTDYEKNSRKLVAHAYLFCAQNLVAKNNFPEAKEKYIQAKEHCAKFADETAIQSQLEKVKKLFPKNIFHSDELYIKTILSRWEMFDKRRKLEYCRQFSSVKRKSEQLDDSWSSSPTSTPKKKRR